MQLSKVAELLGTPVEILSQALTQRVVAVSEVGMVETKLTVHEARCTRESVAKVHQVM